MTLSEAVLFLSLLALAGVLLTGAWVPPLFHCLGCYHVRNTEDTAPPLQRMKQPDYRDFAAQLQALGFTPLSGYRKTAHYFLFHWSKTFQGRVFLAQDRLTVAKIYWLNAFDLPRLSFNTLLGNGALLETSNALEELRVEQPDHIRWGRVTRDFDALYTLHQEVVANRSVASAPQPFNALADVLAAGERVDRHSLKRTRSSALVILLINLLFLSISGSLVAQELGDHPCALPATGVLGGGLSLLVLHLYHLCYIRLHRQAELARAKPIAPSNR